MAPNSDQENRLWAMACHLSALAGFVGIPFGNILGPLVVWLIKREQSAFVDDQGKESLNFQLSMTVYAIVSLVLALVLIGFVLLFALMLADLVFVILASIEANNGRSYRYPRAITIRFIR